MRKIILFCVPLPLFQNYNINQTMNNSSYDSYRQGNIRYPAPHSSQPFKINTKDQNCHKDISTSATSRKQWKDAGYHDLKKVPQDISFLRQTVDFGTNIRIREQLQKFDLSNEKYSKNSFKYPQFNYSIKINSLENNSLSGSKEFSLVNKGERHDKNDKSCKPAQNSSQDRKILLQDKLKSYQKNFDKVQDQLQASKKLREELRIIKQNRQQRKRKQRQKNHENKYQRDLNQQTFQQKNFYERKTKKEPIMRLHNKILYNKSSSMNLSVENYKNDNIYSPIKEPQTALKKKFKEEKTTIIQPQSPGLSQQLHNHKRSITQYSPSFYNQVNQFVLVKKLGEGRFGTVYQAFHKPTRMIVALKKISKDVIKSLLMIDQLILEVKLQTYLKHQNINQIYHFFDDLTHIYLVLEFMEEGTLYSKLKKNKKLGEAQVSQKIHQISLALKDLHDNCIAHRDIKPQNIIISHGVCKLCDFGWATICQDRRTTYCGTLDYVPPQILEGAQYDYTVDLWCLGILTYELLVGKAPFYHMSKGETKKRIMNVQNTNIEYPQYLSRIAISFIDSLLKKDPKLRLDILAILQHPFLRR